MSDPLRAYTASQDLLARKVFGRAILFRKLGGTLCRPDPQAFLPEEDVWYADLFGTQRSGNSCDEAIIAWACEVQACTPPRATDGRPDCPFNGAAPAPATRNATAAACP